MTKDESAARRRQLIKTLHPDVGGDTDSFVTALAEFDRHNDVTIHYFKRTRRHEFKKFIKQRLRRRYVVLR